MLLVPCHRPPLWEVGALATPCHRPPPWAVGASVGTVLCEEVWSSTLPRMTLDHHPHRKRMRRREIPGGVRFIAHPGAVAVVERALVDGDAGGGVPLRSTPRRAAGVGGMEGVRVTGEIARSEAAPTSQSGGRWHGAAETGVRCEKVGATSQSGSRVPPRRGPDR